MKEGYWFRTGYGWRASIRHLDNAKRKDWKLAGMIEVGPARLRTYYLVKIRVENETLNIITNGRNVTAAEIVDLLKNQQLRTVQIATVAAIFQNKRYLPGSQGFNVILNAIELNTTPNIATLIT